jgi:CheY-like chemotaxis protein
MVELVSAAILIVAAEMGKGVAGEAGKALWEGIVSAYERWRGARPEPEAIDKDTAEALIHSSPELTALARTYLTGSTALRRARLVTPALQGAKILWVDDHPEWNQHERQALVEFGIRVTSVETTRSAIGCLDSGRFDLVLSDIARGESATEGIDALPVLSSAGNGVAVVFYVGRVDGTLPRGAFGITASPTELLHLCMDVLERTRA